ncbi:TonB-dependent siderophore receptor [Psychromonas sp. KJ10-2]|uniref:TonB-dependent siderophore receptor n=1 Tax=Psychromonas sp. KJ10-2 TaxID=3391822 RepID=UPI0039B5F436
MSSKSFTTSKSLSHLAVGSALITALCPTSFAAEVDAEDGVSSLDTITVTAESEQQGINNTVDSTATKMNLTLKETGRSVVRVSEKEISDMAAEDTRDVAEYVASFHTESSAARRVIVRGIETNIDNFMVNGLRSLQGGETGTGSRLPSTYNLESATFLTGSDAILYGTGVGGGMVNVTTKKPKKESETTLGIKNRSFVSDDTGYFERNQTSVNIDSTGELASDKVLYRINAELTPDADGYQEGRSYDDQLVDASLTFLVGEDTKITPRVEYKNQERVGGSAWTDGVFTTNFANGTLGDTTSSYGSVINRGSYYGSPLDKGTTESTTLELSVEHQLQNWTLNARAAAVRTESESQDLYISNSSALGNSIGDTTFERKWVYAKGEDQYALLDMNAEGKFDTGELEHHLIAGANFRYKETKFMRNFQDNAEAVGLYTIDLYDPDSQLYSAMPDSLKDGDFSTATDKELNLYLKDRISLNDFTLALGVGFTKYVGEETSSSDDAYDQDLTNFIYDLGVVYRLTPEINLFASYSQAYEPVDTSNLIQYGQDGVEYESEESDNYEIGVKGDFFDKKLDASVTLFYINTKNPTSTETIDGERVLTQELGEAFRSTGVEVDAIFHFNDQISSRVSYAYTDAHDTTGDDAGRQANYTPYHAFSVWNSYAMQNEPMRFALGMRAEGSRNDDDYTIPGYAEFDFGAYYEMDKWDVSLVVRNLFDKSRVVTTPNWVSAEANDPRSITLDFKYRL